MQDRVQTIYDFRTQIANRMQIMCAHVDWDPMNNIATMTR